MVTPRSSCFLTVGILFYTQAMSALSVIESSGVEEKGHLQGEAWGLVGVGAGDYTVKHAFSAWKEPRTCLSNAVKSVLLKPSMRLAWRMPGISVLRRQRQEDQEFKAGLSYIRPYFKNTK